jgi:hypothetical protein
MTRSEIIKAVKARLDELTPYGESNALLESEGLTKPVEQYVDDFLDEATDTVRLLASARRMLSKSFETYWDGSDGRDEWDDVFKSQKLPNSELVYYTLPVPGDFLKIAEVQMGNWARSCFSAFPADGEAYRMLRNPHTTAGPAKPAVVVNGEGIELYGSRVGDVTLFTGRYIDRRHYNEDANSMEQDELVDLAIIWRCALLVLGAMGREELKQAEGFYVEAVNRL